MMRGHLNTSRSCGRESSNLSSTYRLLGLGAFGSSSVTEEILSNSGHFCESGTMITGR